MTHRWTFASILFALFVLPYQVFAADTVTVERVIDGDTFVTTENERVRLIGVDAPEITDNECMSAKAKNVLTKWIEGKEVVLKYDEDKYDRYDRTLAYVYEDNFFINRRLLIKGLATVYTVSPNDAKESNFEKAQIVAQKGKKNIWSQCKTTINAYAPNRVKKPTVSSITTNSATISWKKAARAKTYKLQYGFQGNTSPLGTIKKIKTRSYTLTGLDSNTEYWVRISSTNPVKAKKYSKKRLFTTDAVDNGSNDEDDSVDVNMSYDCSANIYNCSDFSTHDEAQAVYDYCFAQVGTDVHGLDGSDNDGLACESLN